MADDTLDVGTKVTNPDENPDDNIQIPIGEEDVPKPDYNPDPDVDPGDNIQIPIGEEISPDKLYELELMRHAYQKLDDLPLGFGLPAYSEDIDNETVEKYFGICLLDVVRETGVDLTRLSKGSYEEKIIEDRIVYYTLKRFRLTSSAFFKFSTATDGKTVDKTNVPKMLKELIDEYDKEYKEFKSKSAGNIWTRTATLNYTNV